LHQALRVLSGDPAEPAPVGHPKAGLRDGTEAAERACVVERAARCKKRVHEVEVLQRPDCFRQRQPAHELLSCTVAMSLANSRVAVPASKPA
jgi:hypothetical protein